MHNTRISPVIVPSPPPTIPMESSVLASVFMVFLLPCIGLCLVLLLYLLLLWLSKHRLRFGEPVKPVIGKGLTMMELEKLPKLTGKELVVVARSMECAVCLEDIENAQLARLVPGCNHVFHQLCVDTWLSDHTVCPVCRGEIASKLSQFSENYSPC